jgi:hypothetical protein
MEDLVPNMSLAIVNNAAVHQEIAAKSVVVEVVLLEEVSGY